MHYSILLVKVLINTYKSLFYSMTQTCFGGNAGIIRHALISDIHFTLKPHNCYSVQCRTLIGSPPTNGLIVLYPFEP